MAHRLTTSEKIILKTVADNEPTDIGVIMVEAYEMHDRVDPTSVQRSIKSLVEKDLINTRPSISLTGDGVDELASIERDF